MQIEKNENRFRVERSFQSTDAASRCKVVSLLNFNRTRGKNFNRADGNPADYGKLVRSNSIVVCLRRLETRKPLVKHVQESTESCHLLSQLCNDDTIKAEEMNKRGAALNDIWRTVLHTSRIACAKNIVQKSCTEQKRFELKN